MYRHFNTNGVQVMNVGHENGGWIQSNPMSVNALKCLLFLSWLLTTLFTFFLLKKVFWIHSCTPTHELILFSLSSWWCENVLKMSTILLLVLHDGGERVPEAELWPEEGVGVLGEEGLPGAAPVRPPHPPLAPAHRLRAQRRHGRVRARVRGVPEAAGRVVQEQVVIVGAAQGSLPPVDQSRQCNSKSGVLKLHDFVALRLT